MVTIAALTSVISLLEVATQFVIQKFRVKRKKATLILALFCFLVSIPVAWSVGGAFDGAITLFGFDILTFFDEMTNTVLMPVGAFLSCLAIGWFIEKGPFKKRINPFNTLRSLEVTNCLFCCHIFLLKLYILKRETPALAQLTLKYKKLGDKKNAALFFTFLNLIQQ